MDSTAADERPPDEMAELRVLVAQLRGHLQHHVRLGAWAAPGGATAAWQPTFDVDELATTDTGIAADDAATASHVGTEAVPVEVTDASHAHLEAREVGTFDEPIQLGRRTLAQIRDELGDCQRCKLCSTRNKIVFGVGADDAPIMFIGEAPGEQEDRRGEPFVGPAGELLDRMIEAMGWTRQHVYIANTLKCLRYNALVQLGDGTWERIGRLVRSRYTGDVMSVDEAGCLVRRRVTDWFATPLADRAVYRLSYESAKGAGVSRVAIQLTGDHEVLTNTGYVAVERLPEDARIATGQGLSDVARDVVIGSLLGDATIPMHAGTSAISFTHSKKQEAYALFKRDLLSELVCTATTYRVTAGGHVTYPVINVRSRAHRALRPIASAFYGPRKRVPPELAYELTARMVAIWFLDDGYLRIRPPRRESAEIATCAFSPEDLQTLIAGLSRLGLEANALRGRLHFDVEQTRRLSALIAPFVPPCMRRKLCPDIEQTIPYDPRRWAIASTPVNYERAVVERVAHTGSDKTFFCIDVEGTHNFVTAGGVVHNCRPPGNRNPQPDETAKCTPFLDAQINAIAPRIIVTLGRPAANHVLGRDAPISALRGKFHDRQGVKVMPTFHPAYLLRDPDKKRDTWSDLKQVIAELERLGIKPPNPPRG